MFNLEQIRDKKHDIDALRVDDLFYWVDFTDDEEEIFYCFTVDDGYKVDKEFAFEELAENKNIVFYGLRVL